MPHTPTPERATQYTQDRDIQNEAKPDAEIAKSHKQTAKAKAAYCECPKQHRVSPGAQPDAELYNTRIDCRHSLAV
jgi:hypothetical protein